MKVRDGNREELGQTVQQKDTADGPQGHRQG
ncbi:MAG: hypothetical protein RLZZ398_2197, partial [Verrucomicrobiota bacterium]